MVLFSINAIRDLGRVKGSSGGHFFLCEDQNEYIVKFIERNKTAVNELVAGSLATMIKLPTPDMVLIRLAEDLINLSDDLSQRNIEPGLHIGFRRLSNVCELGQLTQQTITQKTLLNPEDLYGIVCFDNWVLNIDRNNEGNNMVEILANNQMRYYAVDFGHCFTGNRWNEELQNSKDIMECVQLCIFPFIYNRICQI